MEFTIYSHIDMHLHWDMPARYGEVVPYRAGETLPWAVTHISNLKI